MSMRLILTSLTGELSRSARRVAQSPVRSRFVRATAASAVTAAWSLVDPQPLTATQRALHRMISGTLAGVMAMDLAREDPIVDPLTDGVLLTGSALVLAGPMEVIDRSVTEAMRQIGIRHPRIVWAALGAGAAALTYALAAPGKHDAEAWIDYARSLDSAEARELDATTAALLEAMLAPAADGEDAPGAAAAREQVERARCLGSADAGFVEFVIAEGAPRIVPHQQVWPVSLLCDRGGHLYRVELSVHGGYVNTLTMTPAGDPLSHEAAMQVLTRRPELPGPTEVTVVREGA